MNTELLELAADTRLAQLDLNAARRAHALGQVTDRELSMTEAERDSALEFYEEAEALADEAAPLFAPRPWLADGAYVPAESRDELVSRETPTLTEEPRPTRDAEQLDLAVRGLRQGGWARQSAEALLSARAAGRRSELDSLTARLRRDLANGDS